MSPRETMGMIVHMREVTQPPLEVEAGEPRGKYVSGICKFIKTYANFLLSLKGGKYNHMYFFFLGGTVRQGSNSRPQVC